MLLTYAAKLPDPPSSGLLTRYVLENPLPVAIVLLLMAAIFGWLGMRDGTKSNLGLAGAALAVAALVFALGTLITTSAEHGEDVTRELVERVVANDISGAMQLFTDDATVSLASPNNPGLSIEFVRAGLDRVSAESIVSNRIRMLNGFSESSDTAIVHLGCLTDTNSFLTPSKWILRIQRQDDDQWKVTQLTCVSIANQTPQQNWIGY